MNRFAIAALVTASVATIASAQWFDSGAAGSFSTSNWGVDRFAPATWQPGATAPDSSTALLTSTSNADRRNIRSLPFSFYDYHGRQRSAGFAGQTSEMGVELYIPASWMSGANLRDASIWGRDNGVDANATATYPTIGFGRQNYAAYNAYINNPSPTQADYDTYLQNYYDATNANVTSSFYVWNPVSGALDTFNIAVNVDGWNSFRIVDTGSAFDLYFNGVLATSQTGAAYSLASFEGFTTAFLQLYNFGNENNAPGNALGIPVLADSGYDAYWRNAYTAVPTPGAAALLGIAGLAATRRRR